MSSHRSDKHDINRHRKRVHMDINVDNLFPSDVRSGTRGKNLDVETLFSNTPLSNEPEITFTSNILLEKREKRRKEKLKYYTHMLKYCHKRISDADDDQGSDIVFTIIDSVPECKDYDSMECLEFISIKLREEDFDTTILTPTTMFITWKYLELKKQDRKDAEKKEKENKILLEKDRDRDNDRSERKHKDIVVNKAVRDDMLYGHTQKVLDEEESNEHCDL